MATTSSDLDDGISFGASNSPGNDVIIQDLISHNNSWVAVIQITQAPRLPGRNS